MAFMRAAGFPLEGGIHLWSTLAFTFVCALCLHYVVEEPLRRVEWSARQVIVWLFVVPAVTSSLMISSTIVLFPISSSNTTLSNFPQQPTGRYLHQNCICFDVVPTNCNCTVAEAVVRKRRMLVLGDSHAWALTPFLRVIAAREKYELDSFSEGGAPVLVNPRPPKDYIPYGNVLPAYLAKVDKLLDLPHYEVVAIIQYWDNYFAVHNQA